MFDIFCFDFGAAVAKIFNKYKKISPEKSFWKLWVLIFPPKPQFSKLLGLLWFWREDQNSEFPKTFFGWYLFVFVEYLCNRSPKIKANNIKHYSSILAIVNHRNWLDDSLPLTYGTLPGAPRLSGKTFLIFTCFWPERKSQSARGPTQSKCGPVNNMVCRGNYLLYILQ